MTLKIIYNGNREEYVRNVLSIAFNDGFFSYAVTAGEAITLGYNKDDVRLVVVI